MKPRVVQLKRGNSSQFVRDLKPVVGVWKNITYRQTVV